MRRAFVMASNGPQGLGALKFALSDAELIGNCLASSRCGFEVQRVEHGASNWQVRQQLFEAAESCGDNDTFICYFAGHGWHERQTLYLVWDSTALDRLLTTSIPVSDLMEAMKQCKAHNKLLVLDCCHAGSVVEMMGMRDVVGVPVKELGIRPENFVVLMASDRIERARELERLGGGFLSTTLCRALSADTLSADKDQDNRISIEDIRTYLEEEAIRHNREQPAATVPRPYIFGQLRGDFYLTVDVADMERYEFEWIDGSVLVLIPTIQLMQHGRVFCIGKHPITNAQWRRADLPEPVGEQFSQDGRWIGPFYPWRTDEYGAPTMPVVCVSLDAAQKYAWRASSGAGVRRLVRAHTRLPTAKEWDHAAFGTPYPRVHPQTWLGQSRTVHHQAAAPAPIDLSGARSNSWGLSDMIGNIWEWCTEDDWASARLGVSDKTGELRGGGFLDDLTRTKPFISARELADGDLTVHCDLGFRIAADLKITDLPEDIQQRYYGMVQRPGRARLTI